MKLFQKVKENRKKKNNKGFSLVELIIVIAIMAILIAVLAPTFTKYVDRSRQSNDATMVAGVVNAVQAALVDSEYATKESGYQITFDNSGAKVNKADGTAVTTGDEMDKAITEACGSMTNLKPTAKKWTKIEVVVSSGGIEYKGDFKTYVEAQRK